MRFTTVLLALCVALAMAITPVASADEVVDSRLIELQAESAKKVFGPLNNMGGTLKARVEENPDKFPDYYDSFLADLQTNILPMLQQIAATSADSKLTLKEFLVRDVLLSSSWKTMWVMSAKFGITSWDEVNPYIAELEQNIAASKKKYEKFYGEW
jgi:hypothetical protein